MKNLNLSGIILLCCILNFTSCSKKDEPSCSDGIKNQTETGVDCGGPCTACPPSCSDGIKNQSEEGIDCGGPCAACPTSCTYKWGGIQFNAPSPVFHKASGRIDVYASSGLTLSNITFGVEFISPAVLQTGVTYNFASLPSNYSSYLDAIIGSSGTFYTVITSGTLTYSKLDYTNNLASGTFNFTASGNPVLTVTEGIFTNIPAQ